MIGMTRSSTKRRTESLTASSSAENWLSIAKKSSMRLKLVDSLTSQLVCLSLRPGPDTDLTRLAPKFGPMVECPARFRLPLVHHLVQQCRERVIPAVTPDVPATDRDFGG